MLFREDLLCKNDKKVINKKNKKFKIIICIFLFLTAVLIVGNYGFNFFKNDNELIDKKEDNHSISMAHSSVKELTGIGRPISVIKDSYGKLYICDFDGHNVKIFDSSLSLSKQIGGNSKGDREGEFYMPHAIDFDADGNIYVTDYGNKRIQKFSKSGEFVSVLNPERNLSGPATSYFDKEFNLYVADYGSHSIIKLSKEGKFLGWIGAKEDNTLTNGWEMTGVSAKSTKPGGFYKVHSVKFDRNGIMYVADMENHRIQRLSKEGKFLGWIGAKEDNTLTNGWEMTGVSAKSTKPGGFNAPIAIDFINGKELVVLEYGNPRIQRFSEEGKFLGWFGGTEDGGVTDGWKTEGLSREGVELGSFQKAYDFRIYGNTMYVADTGNTRVQIIEFHK